MTQVRVTKLNVLLKKKDLYIYVCGGAESCIFVCTWRPEGGIGHFLLSGSIFSFEAGFPLDLGLCFPSETGSQQVPATILDLLPLSWGYRCEQEAWLATWVLGLELQSYDFTISDFRCWTISPASLLPNLSYTVYLTWEVKIRDIIGKRPRQGDCNWCSNEIILLFHFFLSLLPSLIPFLEAGSPFVVLASLELET